MAKINPLFGKGTGKVGAFLLQVYSGVQILKEKPVKVANPNTDAQVEQRAKLKLMSQIAADMAPSIAFQKIGLVSARNQFISANIGKCTFNEGKAGIELEDIELTGGSGYLPIPAVGENNAVALSAAAPSGVNAVVYAAYQRDEVNQLTLIEQKIVSVAGENNTFPTTMELPNASYVVYAYGVKNNGKASVIDYMDYTASISEGHAVLESVRAIIVKGGSLTATMALLHGGH